MATEMTLEEIVDIVSGEFLVKPPFDIAIEHACASDLMSDVLHFVKPDMLLITGLTNPQAVRTADMAEAPAIVFVRGKYPAEGVLTLAEELGIGVILSPYTLFEASGLLYAAGLKGLGKLPIMHQR